MNWNWSLPVKTCHSRTFSLSCGPRSTLKMATGNLFLLAVATILVGWACVVEGAGGRNDSFCTKPKPAVDPATGTKLKPPNKPILSSNFETHIVLNIISGKMTKEFHQYYSFDQDHSVIDEREYGHREYGYAQYSTGELLVVTPADLKCTVTNLSTSEQRFIFGYKKSHNKGHLPSPEAVLHILQPEDDSVEIYVGKQTARGIPCDVWYSCTYWEDMKSTMDIHWYFSDPQKWKPSDGSASVPVRARVKGVRYNELGQPRQFDHNYDFIHWKNRITRPGYYQTPKGAACPGRILTKQAPTLPDQFSFTLEQVDRTVGLITFIREKFDVKRKLFRFQMRARGKKTDLFGDNVLDEIHDFNTGVAYIIDTARGNCSVSPIEENDLDDTSDSQGHVTMRTAAELLLLAGTGQKPVYTGSRTIRGIDCDVWVAKRVNYPPGTKLNATWEWAFVNASWVYTDQGSNPLPKGGTLMQLSLTQGYKTVTYYNIYNFRQDPLSFSHFDISPCYENRKRRIFSISFPGTSASTIAVNLQYFKDGVVQQIAALTGLSPLRVGSLQVNFENVVKVTFEILDKTPIPGDVKTVKQEVDLAKAGDAIYKAVRTNKFSVPIVSANGTQIAQPISADPNSIVEKEYTQAVAVDAGYSKGVTATVSVVMVLVGMTAGGGGAFVFNKRMPGKAV
ncbi:hypothetical protein RRG08_035612 [Elysia crispata]|uniref:Uncharacterized protein n=1 Tax=Elysia crispata TaxID=231223 RepID=A0AAE1B5P9_9GAST|nr:hypothetical protein RRG08_035612 [Elysia crispata]